MLLNHPEFGEEDLITGINRPEVPRVSRAVIGHVLNELMQVFKIVQEIIATSIIRKSKVDGLIQIMKPNFFYGSHLLSCRSEC